MRKPSRSGLYALLPLASLLGFSVGVMAVPAVANAENAQACIENNGERLTNVCDYAVAVAWCAETPSKTCRDFTDVTRLNPGGWQKPNYDQPYTRVVYGACRGGTSNISYNFGSFRYDCS